MLQKKQYLDYAHVFLYTAFVNVPCRHIEFVPIEYHEVVQNLWNNKNNALYEYAKALGVEHDYQCITSSPEAYKELFPQFKKNIILLITKTWVEDCEQQSKERLQGRIPAFLRKLESENYTDALKDFIKILSELASLFFGEQIFEDDVVNYAFRIDLQLGLFIWYVLNLSDLANSVNAQPHKLLLLGICYLSKL